MPRSSARTALILALCGFVSLSLGDALVKSMAGAWPGTAVSALRYAFGAAGAGLVVALTEGRKGFAHAAGRGCSSGAARRSRSPRSASSSA